MTSPSYRAPKATFPSPSDPSTNNPLSGNDAPFTVAKWAYRIIRAALAIIFIWSGISKLIDPDGFATIIEAYGLLPDKVILPSAVALSLLELAAGIGLVVDLRGSLGIITGLLILFMIILGYGLWLGLDVDCGCFGPEDPEGRAYHSLRPALYRDTVMLAGIAYLYFLRWRRSLRPVGLSTIFQPHTHFRRRK